MRLKIRKRRSTNKIFNWPQPRSCLTRGVAQRVQSRVYDVASLLHTAFSPNPFIYQSKPPSGLCFPCSHDPAQVDNMLASIYLFLLALRGAMQCVSGSTIVTYTDSNCSYPSLQLSGPDNGICQQSLSGVGSFKITTLDAGCVGMPFASPGHFPRSMSYD